MDINVKMLLRYFSDIYILGTANGTLKLYGMDAILHEASFLVSSIISIRRDSNHSCLVFVLPQPYLVSAGMCYHSNKLKFPEFNT